MTARPTRECGAAAAPLTPPPFAAPELFADDLVLAALAEADTPAGRAAYDRLVARHRPWLLRHLMRLLRDEGDAQDVAQEAFTRAYLALRRRPPHRSFRAWLRVLATRLAYNQRREAQTRLRHHSRIVLPELDGRRHDGEHELVERLLQSLEASERDVLILRYVEECSVEEIAHALGIGVSAAKMRVLRARRALLARHAAVMTPPFAA